MSDCDNPNCNEGVISYGDGSYELCNECWGTTFKPLLSKVTEPSYAQMCRGAYREFLEPVGQSLVMPRENQGRDGLYDGRVK